MYQKRLNNFCRACGKYFCGQTANTCPECVSNGHKWCKTCDTVKVVTDFPFSPGNGTWDSRCRVCHNAASRNRKREIRSTAEGREHMNSIMREYNAFHRDEADYKAYMKMHCQANRNKAKGKYTTAEWIECLEMFKYECAYCGSKDNLTLDHIVAVSKGGYNFIFNIVPACATCNSSKQATDVVQWYSSKTFYSNDKLIKIHKWYRDKQAELLSKNSTMEG